MLFKKKEPADPWRVPWDDRTLERITEADSFNVQITSATKRFGFGHFMEHRAFTEQEGFDISGLVTLPKFLPVQLNFDERADDEFPFGCWFYHCCDHQLVDRKIRFPFLEFCITDPGCKIRAALFEAHKAAIYSGKRHSSARFHKRKGDGVMTPKEREQNWSSESRYPLIGAITWAEVQSTKLPSWAYPQADENFSVENLPARIDLKL